MNERLFKAAIEAIKRLFSDTSVSREVTKNRLHELAEEIQMLLSALED